MEYFKEAFVVAPRHPLPRHYMGLLLARQGHWPEAQVHFLKATQADPTYPMFHYNLACYECQLGNLEIAKERLKKAFELESAYRIKALEDDELKPLWDSF